VGKLTATVVAVKERPILFSTEMVKAIMAGRKTQTRRVCKPMAEACRTYPGAWIEPNSSYPEHFLIHKWPRAEREFSNFGRCENITCPYGVPGNRLWVRETFLLRAAGKIGVYKAELNAIEAAGFGAMYGGWKSSIHMPRRHSRITLEITKVRVERVQQITEADARAEGCDFDDAEPPEGYGEKDRPTAYSEYRYLWDKINAKRGFGWDTNPFVWVIEFKRL
jgi:hypothetical protein